MEKWQQSLVDSITDPEEIAKRFSVDPEPVVRTAALYPLRITRSYLDLVEMPGDPVWRQCVPDPLELADAAGASDPLDEERLAPVPGLIHRYPDRVVWLVSGACAVYCRFCMRKRLFGADCSSKPATDVDAALAYLSAHAEIRDVILSGGDPLMLPDEALDHLLGEIRRIPHVDIIRIGTRLPVTLPERITPSFCALLRKHHPVYLNTHFNHPREITAEVAAACAMLADAGVQLGNQTVLLKGVNDDPAVMRELNRLLLKIRVRPYYLHQMDLVRGTAHFRTSIDTGLKILRELRGHCSGLAVPHFVVDLPGGKGKVPVLPEAAERVGNSWVFTNYLGERITYEDM